MLQTDVKTHDSDPKFHGLDLESQEAD